MLGYIMRVQLAVVHVQADPSDLFCLARVLWPKGQLSVSLTVVEGADGSAPLDPVSCAPVNDDESDLLLQLDVVFLQSILGDAESTAEEAEAGLASKFEARQELSNEMYWHLRTAGVPLVARSTRK